MSKSIRANSTDNKPSSHKTRKQRPKRPRNRGLILKFSSTASGTDSTRSTSKIQWTQYFLGVKLGLFPVTVTSHPDLLRAAPARDRARALSLAYVARLTRTNLSGEPARRLRAHRDRQGPDAAPGHRPARPAQLAHPGGHLHRLPTSASCSVARSSPSASSTSTGVGGYLFTGIHNRDGVSVVGTVTVLVLVFLLANLLVDLLYGVLDPRISHD